jgi:glutamate N-acetyltransferase / amino-acid N-acetyltransferase
MHLETKEFEHISGGVTAARGFKASGIEAGIKYATQKDMALIAGDKPCTVAAMFTTNRVQAAPVRVSRERERGGVAQAVIVNSGNANACTGDEGVANANAMTGLTAQALEIDESLVMVCSTGVIGVQLPMERITAGVVKAAAALSVDGADDAARAIMTTDTVDKQSAVACSIDGKRVVIGGMAKGSGMIEPEMATMLAFITTDVAIGSAALKLALRAAVVSSFNRVVVDGDRSTNDTVIALASGVAGNDQLDPTHSEWSVFTAALGEVCLELAKKMVMDGEGATKFVAVRVSGARSEADAQLAARAVARSPLVKTAFYGADPNWGRVIAAVGYSGADVDEAKAQIAIGETIVYNMGLVADQQCLDEAAATMRKRVFDLAVDLNLGDHSDTVFTCDLSHEYITINAEYTT